MIWKTSKLAEISKIGDGAHASLKRVESGIPYLTAKNITKSGIDYSNLDYISEDTYNKYFSDKSNALTRPKKDDILYSIIGSIGGVYLVRDEKIGISSSVAIFRSNTEIIIPQYLAYFLKSDSFDAQIQAIKGGVAQGFLSLGKLGTVTISYPNDIDYQKKIIAVLSTYDDLIENNKKQISLLEEAARRLYKEWFVDLRFPGYEDVAIVDGVPKGWTYKPFSEVFDYVRGKSYTSKDLSDTSGVLMANLKSIRAFGGYNRKAEKRFIGQYKADQMLFAGDVVMGVTDMTQERRLIGHVALVPNMGEKMIFSMDLIKLIPKLVDSLFLYSMLCYGGLSKQISPLANGVNVLHLRPETMMGIQMLVPSAGVLERYHQQFTLIVAQIEILQKQCDIAVEARDRLLPKLMSGKLEV